MSSCSTVLQLRWRRLASFLAGLVLLLLGVFSVEAVHAEASALPDPDVEIYTDATAALTLSEVLAGGEEIAFEPASQDGVPAQYTRDAIWLKVRIASTETTQVLMALTPTFVDQIDVYRAIERPGLTADAFDHMALGSHRPLASKAYSGLDEVVPLNLEAGETTLLYIRVASPNVTLLLNLRLYRPAAYIIHNTLESTVSGIVLGSLCLLLITQIMLYQFDRDPLYLLLAVSTLSAAAYHMAILGYARLLLFPSGGTGNDLFLAFFSSFGLTAAALTTARAFDLRERRNWMYWNCVLAAVVGLVCTAAIFVGGNLYAAPIRTLWIQLFTTLTAVYGLATIRRGDWASYLRAAAFAVLWVGMTGMLLYYWNVPGLPQWASKGYAIACLFEALLLTAMLSWRLKTANRLNTQLQQEALETARNSQQRAMEIVRERTSELAKAKQTAEAALAAEREQQKNQIRFMEVISHQYRTPLASIRSNIDTIGLSLADGDVPNQQRIARIRRGILRLVEVLEVNLERSRVQGSSLEPKRSRTSVKSLVVDAACRGRELMPDAEIVVDIAAEAGAAEINVDAHMISLALINLLENAVKYSVPTGSAPVHLSVAMQGGKTVICVTDSGVGIPANEIAGVRDPEVRGSNVTKIKGTGLGLSLVSRVVSAHDAQLEIESSEEEGTSVKIIFGV